MSSVAERLWTDVSRVLARLTAGRACSPPRLPGRSGHPPPTPHHSPFHVYSPTLLADHPATFFAVEFSPSSWYFNSHSGHHGSPDWGDSVRGSLETLSLQRLGDVDFVVQGPRFFRQNLTAELSAAWKSKVATVSPAIIVTGSVQTGQIKSENARRAGHVNVYGVDATFWTLAGVAPPGAGTRHQPPTRRSVGTSGRRQCLRRGRDPRDDSE